MMSDADARQFQRQLEHVRQLLRKLEDPRQREHEAEEARQRHRKREEEEARQCQREREAEEARQRQRNREEEEARRASEIANAWRSYESRWSLLNQSPSQRQAGSASLTFERIPWPVVVTVANSSLDGRRTRRALEEHLLRPEAIREFLLSPAHSPGVSSKDRIRAALRRWHPDKFVRMASMIVESDRDAVTDGVGIVARCLNEMLERENGA